MDTYRIEPVTDPASGDLAALLGEIRTVLAACEAMVRGAKTPIPVIRVPMGTPDGRRIARPGHRKPRQKRSGGGMYKRSS